MCLLWGPVCPSGRSSAIAAVAEIDESVRCNPHQSLCCGWRHALQLGNGKFRRHERLVHRVVEKRVRITHTDGRVSISAGRPVCLSRCHRVNCPKGPPSSGPRTSRLSSRSHGASTDKALPTSANQGRGGLRRRPAGIRRGRRRQVAACHLRKGQRTIFSFPSRWA